MSLVSFIGPRPEPARPRGHGASSKRLEVRQPILTNEDLEKIRCDRPFRGRASTPRRSTSPMTSSRGADGHDATRSTRLCERAEEAVHGGYNIIILSDRMVGPDRIPIPALLATAAVHHHLIRKGLRTSVGLVVETGEAREVHHFALLAGYGAEAINPYLAFETLAAMADGLARGESTATRRSSATSRRSTRACSRSCRRWASRPTSPIAARRSSTPSACRSAFVDEYFTGTATHDRGRRPRRDRRGDGRAATRDAFGDVAGLSRRARRRRRIRLPHARRGA